jgi:uncharacterized protein (TIGR04255 family)
MAGRQYPRAPITEAVFGWQFAEPIEDDAIKKVQTRFRDDYPFAQDIRESQFNIDAVANTAQVLAIVKGFRMATLDQLDVVSIANSRLSVSRMAPYLGWESFRTKAETNWGI